jgi:hypothetical protein
LKLTVVFILLSIGNRQTADEAAVDEHVEDTSSLCCRMAEQSVDMHCNGNPASQML